MTLAYDKPEACRYLTVLCACRKSQASGALAYDKPEACRYHKHVSESKNIRNCLEKFITNLLISLLYEYPALCVAHNFSCNPSSSPI